MIDNNRDKALRGRGNVPRGADHYCTKISDRDVRRIRKLCAAKILTHHEIADLFHVNVNTIKKISRGVARPAVS